MKDKPLYILTYDHGGFVLWGNAVKPRLKELVEWMEKYPKLKIGLDYESFTFDEYSKVDTEIMDIIKYLLEKYPDRVGLGATTYGQPLSLFISEESNIRQLTYAVRTNLKHFGQTPNVYAISEFALNNQTPQMIKLCGYDAAILRSHVMGYGYTKNFDLPWGRWIGKDLTEVPAVPTYEEQGRGFNCTTLDNWIMSRWPREGCYWSLEEFEEKFKHISPLLCSRYDDLTQEVKDITEYIETKDDYKYVLLEDLPELYGEAKEEIRTNDNDFHVQMPWGYCGNEIFNGCREAEVAAVQAEKLNALSVMLGGVPMQTTLEQAWKYALVAQHHDVTICGLLDLSRRFIPDSLKLSKEVIESSLDVIKKRFADKDNESVIVANSHSFPVDEWIKVDVNEAYSAYDGEELLESEMSADGKNINIHIKLNPFTIKKITLQKTTENAQSVCCWNEEAGLLTTPLYEVKLTEKGIAYIKDTAKNIRIFDNGEGELFTAYVEDGNYSSIGKWSVETSSFGAKTVFEGNVSTVSCRFEMCFTHNSKRIDCKAKFELHGEKVGHTGIAEGLKKSLTIDGHRHEEKMNFVMNMCLDENRRMVRDLPFSISDWNGQIRKNESYWYPEDDIRYDVEVSPEESFASTTYMQGVYWLGMNDENNGIAVFNKGCMGSLVQGNRLEIPLLYSGLYMCGDRILNGVFEDEFALFPYDSSISDAEIHRNAMSYNYKPVGLLNEKGDGDLSLLDFADFTTADGEVILTTFYFEDGAYFARFCNFSDESAVAEFNLNGSKNMSVTDLLGNIIDENIESKLNFRPWEIKTIKISM